MKFALGIVMVVLAGTANAAPQISLQVPPNFSPDAQGFPSLAGKSTAITRINRVLHAANAQMRAQIKECLADGRTQEHGYWWEQVVDTPLLGAHFVSFWAHGNQSCGGAHPNLVSVALVFSLDTGKRVDWNELLPATLRGHLAAGVAKSPKLTPGYFASQQLTDLFVAQAKSDDETPECQEAYAAGPLAFQLWPDAKLKGLAMATSDLPQAIMGVCGGPVTIPLEALKKLGINSGLLQDIETGSH